MNERHPMARGPEGPNWHLIGGILLLVVLALSIRFSGSGSNPIPPNYAPNGVTTATAAYPAGSAGTNPAPQPGAPQVPSVVPATPMVTGIPAVVQPSAAPGPQPAVAPAAPTAPSVGAPPSLLPTALPTALPSAVSPVPPALANPAQPWWRSNSALPGANALLIDPAGTLWAATREGLARMQNGVWTMLRSSDSRFPAPAASSLAHDGKALWIGTPVGLVRTEDGRSFQLLTRADGLIHEIIWSLHWDGQILWIGTQAGVSMRMPDGGFQSFDKKITGGGLADIWIGSIQRRGTLAFFGNDDGLSIWNLQKPAIDPSAWETIDMFATNLPHNWILSQALVDNRLWVGTPAGLGRLDQSPDQPISGAGARWEVFNRQRGLAGDRVNALAGFRQTLWIGTNAGLSRYENGVFRNLGTAEGLMAPDVLSLTWASDTLWVGTSAGVQALDPTRL